MATVTTAMALVAVGCVAGPQPEPPDDPHAGRDGGGGRGPDAPPPPLPDPPAAIDAGAPRPAADAGLMGEPPPWLDPDEVPDSRNDGVAPFPFEPCCGWFVLPEADAGVDAEADAGVDAEADAEADAGADVDAAAEADAGAAD